MSDHHLILGQVTDYLTGQTLPDTLDERYRTISQKQAEVESRLLYAYEVDDACPCGDTVCRQKESEPR